MNSNIERGWSKTLDNMLQFDDPKYIVEHSDEYVFSPLIKLCYQKYISYNAQGALLNKSFLPVLRALATCTNLRKDIQLKLIEFGDQQINVALALNVSCRQEVQDKLKETGDFKVIGCLATKSFKPEMFLKYNNIFVYTCLAANQNISPEVVKTIREKFDDWDIDYALAQNEYCPIDVLTELAKKDLVGIRICVAKNTAINDKIINLLIHDSDPEVRKTLVQYNILKLTRKHLYELCEDNSFEVTEMLASKNLPSDVELKLIESNVFGEVDKIQFNKYKG